MSDQIVSDEIAFDKMNVLLRVPENTVFIVVDVEFMDDTGQRKACAVFHPGDIHWASMWFDWCQEKYYADHQIGDGVDEYPIILPLPDTTYKATIRFGCGGFKDVTAETGGLCDSGWVWKDIVRDVTLSDIKQMRKDFLKYIPDGDDYGVYMLTERGLGYEDTQT